MKIPTIFFIIFLISTSHAQSEFGIKLDGGISKVENKSFNRIHADSDYEEKKYSPSINIGLFFKYRFNKKSVLGTELYYNIIQDKEAFYQLGHTYNSEGFYIGLGDIKHSYNRKSQYINLPIYYGYNIWKFLFKVGFQGSFKLKHEIEFNNESNDSNSSKMQSANNLTTKIDYGPKIGVNFKINKKFSFNFDYYHGIKNINNLDLGYMDYQINIKQITLGIEYNLK